jgi:hypothetical protein
MTSSVVVLGVFVLLVAPTSDLLASLSALLHPALVLQEKRTSKRRTGQVVFVSSLCRSALKGQCHEMNKFFEGLKN